MKKYHFFDEPNNRNITLTADEVIELAEDLEAEYPEDEQNAINNVSDALETLSDFNYHIQN